MVDGHSLYINTPSLLSIHPPTIPHTCSRLIEAIPGGAAGYPSEHPVVESANGWARLHHWPDDNSHEIRTPTTRPLAFLDRDYDHLAPSFRQTTSTPPLGL